MGKYEFMEAGPKKTRFYKRLKDFHLIMQQVKNNAMQIRQMSAKT